MEHTLAVILVQCDHLVHRFFRSIAFSLGLFDLFGIAPLLDNEIEYV